MTRADDDAGRAASRGGVALMTNADDDAEQESDAGARPLAAVRLGIPPAACGGEEWRHG
jgi:hypothetical protein